MTITIWRAGESGASEPRLLAFFKESNPDIRSWLSAAAVAHYGPIYERDWNWLEENGDAGLPPPGHDLVAASTRDRRDYIYATTSCG
jgi:hypothetical protein